MNAGIQSRHNNTTHLNHTDMTSYIFLADGFEEVEALTVVDVMRRAGMAVRTVSITGDHHATGAHGVKVQTDLTFKTADFSDAEWLIVPGGMPGSENLHKFSALGDLLRVHAMHPGKIAGICAAPAVVLAPLGILDGLTATCYPGFEKALQEHGAKYVDDRVVVHENIITANGPSSALLFALSIVANSLGDAHAREIATGMLLYPGTTPFYF